jgi:DNA-binding LacI/PurR family transcriptional regulator
MVADIQNPFFTSMVVGIEKVLQEAGYLTLLGNANENPIQEQKQIEIFLAEDVSGIIFATSMQEVGFYKQILQQGVPLVAVDRNPADLPIDTVETTNAQSANLAVQHLLQDGFQKIGLISGPEHLTTSIQRRQGYEQALVQAGLEIDPSLIYTSNYRQAGGYQGMQSLLEHIQLPGAVLILNNLMALGAMQYLHEQHLRIPEDVAVVGFDDMPWATSLQPPLTVVEQPVYDMGLYAARLMLERIAEPTKPVKHLILENKLVVRRSCGCKQKDGHP